MTILQAGQVAVITGGASGIGLALARAFARKGLRVALADIDDVALRAAEQGLATQGATVLPLHVDVADLDAVQRLREAVISRFGRADVICNNAGVYHGVAPVWQLDWARWRHLFEVNYWGAVHGIQAFVPLFVEQGTGHVVNTASMSGLSTVPGMGDYGPAKHALIALTETLRADLDKAGASGVGVTVLCPAVVHTAMGRRALGLPEVPEVAELAEHADANRNGVPPDMLDPDDLAAAALEAMASGHLYVTPTPGSKQRLLNRLRPIVEAFERAELAAAAAPTKGLE